MRSIRFAATVRSLTSRSRTTTRTTRRGRPYARETGATVWARRGRASAFEAATGSTPDRLFSGGTTIPTGAGPVTVIDTPGHAPEHVAFATDGAVSPATSPWPRAPSSSARPRATFGPTSRHCGDSTREAPTCCSGPRPANRDAAGDLARLIDHRLARERRVRDAVHDGAATLDEILRPPTRRTSPACAIWPVGQC